MLKKRGEMFKRILLTAVLAGGLLFTIPNAADANRKHSDRTEARDRHDNWGERWAGYRGAYGFLHFRGFDRSPDLYYYPVGYEAPGSWRAGVYGPGYYGPVLADTFGDDYYLAYGYRCNGYRDGFYYDGSGRPHEYYGRPFYRRNADCENFFRRHGRWYGTSDCSRFEVEKGYCDDYDRR